MAPPRRRHLAAAPQRRTRTRLLAALTLAAAALAPAAAAQLDLAGSCNVQTAQLAHSWLGLYCNNLNTASYGYNWTWIDLDWCVANRGGQLVGKKDCSHCTTSLSQPAPGDKAAGRHSPGIHNSRLTLDLRCACRSGRSRLPVSSSLNLGCFGRLGNKTLEGPSPK